MIMAAEESHLGISLIGKYPEVVDVRHQALDQLIMLEMMIAKSQPK
jgi:hypothetical protein